MTSGGPNEPAEPVEQRPDDGVNADDTVMLRPDPVVLPDEAVVPDSNLVEPAPTCFTHELMADEPYWFDRVQRTEPRTGEPDGVLPAGTPVVVLVDGERYSRVADGEGRYVEVRTASLRELPSR